MDENTIWKIKDLKIKRVSSLKPKQSYFNLTFMTTLIAIVFFIAGLAYGGHQDE